MSVLTNPTTYPKSLGSDCHEAGVYEQDGVLFCKSCGMPCSEYFEELEEEEEDEVTPEEREENERSNEADYKCDSERDMLYE